VAESELSVEYNDLMIDVGLFLGYSSDPDEQSKDERAEIDRYIQSGLRQFYYPPAMDGVELGYKWSFLTPTTTLATVADQSENDLPDGCSRVLGDFIYAAGTFYPSIPQVSEARMMSLRQDNRTGSQPMYCTVRYKDQEDGEGQRMEVAWWPTPSTAYTLSYRYEAYSGKMSEDQPYALGGMKYAELITESCLAIAEQRANDEKGLHWDEFTRLLRAGVALDRQEGADYFGFMGGTDMDSGVRPSSLVCDNGVVTYKGIEL